MAAMGIAERANVDAWEALFAEWLQNRAQEFSTDESDIGCARRLERQDELARLLCCTPAPAAWAIHSKIEVLEHYLCSRGGRWMDRRELVLLAGIKADLRVFEPGREAA